jgi:hypothetical protein
VIEVLPMPDDNKNHSFVLKMALRNALKLLRGSAMMPTSFAGVPLMW